MVSLLHEINYIKRTMRDVDREREIERKNGYTWINGSTYADSYIVNECNEWEIKLSYRYNRCILCEYIYIVSKILHYTD